MQQLHPRAVWLFFVNYFISAVVLTAIVGAYIFNIFSKFDNKFDMSSFAGWLFACFVLFVAFFFTWAKLTYRFYRYELKEDSFRKEQGVIGKKYVSIPYEKIQNVDISRSLFERILGLSTIQIQTAGASAQVSRRGVWGGGSEAALIGVSHADAEVLRDELVSRSKSTTKSQGL